MSIEHQEFEVLERLLKVAEAQLEALQTIDELIENQTASLDEIAAAITAQGALLQQIADDLAPEPTFPTAIAFREDTMNPTQAGQTQTFTGTLAPAGATYPTDTTFTLTSNDPAVAPTVDTTGLIVSVTYPAGWVESTTTPLAFSYGAASVSASGSLSATITPSAPPAAFPTGITFAQTT